MEKQVSDETCTVQVCARLEAVQPSKAASAEEEVQYCSTAHHDIAAVAAGQTISIVDVGTASIVAVISGLHTSNIVKIAWSPESAAYGTAESWGQRLASVDEGGKAVVWDVSTASPLTVCSSVTERRKHVQQANMVIDMAWGSSNNCLLVLLEPATFVMINADNGVILRTQTIAQGMVLTSIEVDSWQPSSVALTSMSQTLFTLRMGELPPSQGATPHTDVARHEISTPGEGLTKVRWVPNRGLLLLMQPHQLIVYCIESKSTLTRMNLPGKYAPFSKWLTVQGTGTCLGTGDDGGANTLICEHEGGSISVWHDHEGNLKYTLHCYHRLQPGIKSEALGLQSSIVSLVPCLPSFLDSPDQPVSSSRPVTSAPNFMWVLAVMSGGQLWRWRIPLPTPGDSFESLCATGTDTEPVLDLAKTSPSIESLIKLSPSVELNEPPQDSRALLAHSQSLGRLGRRRGSTRDLSGPLTSSQTAPLATSTSDSGPLTAPPRKFLIDSSKKSTTPTTKDRTPSPMGRIEEQTEPPRTPDQLEQHGSKAMSSKSGGDAAVSSAGAVADTSPPSLEAMKCGLPAGATALSVFPALVPTGDVAVFSRTNSRSGPMDVPSGMHSRGPSMADDGEPETPPHHVRLNFGGGNEDESVSLMAVGTAEGTVEVVSVSQGALQPLSMNIVHSFKVAATKTLSVHWLGSTLRFAAMTCTAVGKPENQRYSYTVSVTDLVSTKTVALLRESEATEPLIALRTDPNGRYLAIMPRAGGLQVWCVPIMGKAVKVRTVELPFVAMAWVYPTPQEIGPSPVFSAEMEAVAWPAHYKRQAASRQSSGNGSALQNGGGTGGTPQKDKSQHEPAEAQAAFCFAVSDGRLGSITVTDRGVKKRPVTAPHWTVQYVDRLVVTSIAAMGDLVFIGDSEGVLYQWNTVSGQTMVVPAARKVIRKISVGPPVPASLRSGAGVGAGLARLVLLYGDGTLGVWDVHDASSLEGCKCEGVDKTKLPKFSDAIWVPLPAPLSGGCVAAAISKNSGVTLLDTVDTGEGQDASERRATLQRMVRGRKQRISGVSEGTELMGSPLTSRQAMHLAPASMCHSLRLMPPTVITFLRLVFESGVPISTLTAMGGGNDAERLAAAKSLCRFVLRIPKGASDNDQEQSPTPTYTPPTYTPLDATSLLPTPEMQPLDATSLLPGATSSRSPFRGEALDATTLLPGVKEDEVTPASVCASAALPAVELHDAQAVLQAIDMQSLVSLVQRVSVLRTGDPTKMLLPHEAAAYTAALGSSNPRERACRCIAFAAALVGCGGEARFWTHLHATLTAHDARSSTKQPGNSNQVTLFPYTAAAADAQRRVRWHEQVSSEFMPADWVSVGSNPLADRRMLEYVAIGDYASAAALMMTEAPAVSGTFYRNSVLSISLAGVAASVAKDKADTQRPNSPGRGFQVQTLKVVAEHAREIGDMTMCVVLLCAAGRYAEAVAELQAMDDWQAALSLAERFLSVPERNALLHARAKAHNSELSHSESIWRTVGLFTAAGSLRSAAAVLRSSGLTAAACNFTRICTEMGLVCSVAPGSALESALPESARAKIANPGKRSWLEGGDMTKRSNGLLRSSRGGEAFADAGALLGWVNNGGTWVKEGAGDKGQEGLDPEAAVLVNFDAPEPIGGGEADESVRKQHGEAIQDADRIAQMLSDQRQHVLYVLMELCKSRVW